MTMVTTGSADLVNSVVNNRERETMCNICIDETATAFVFPQEDEDIQTWMDRLQSHDHLVMAMMRHTDEGLEQIAKSYRLQGFTHQEHRSHTHRESRPFFNILYIRDLVFVTYGDIFARAMDWENEPHV